MSDTRKAAFVATLSDGSTVVEGKTDGFTHEPDLRQPWVRLCSFAAEEGLHLTSLRLNLNGRTIHLPKEQLHRFNLDTRQPEAYAIQYYLELEDPLSGSPAQSNFVDYIALYEDFAVHYIQEIDGNKSWVAVTEPDAMMPSPRKLAGDV